MYKSVLESIEGVDIYPAISLVIFFVLFVVLLIKTFKLDENFIKQMSELPLEKENHSDKNFIGEQNG
ncbi:MAG: cytochrome C oxidase Cbb3 [Ignavibacteria bacterium CG2_30_36_16]|nr:cbb3-type cytochrome c oxidase subunit 3 [Ignavibacteria bacterium]OIP54768.1 MAG: cytochrome C oxidase Cbb3 [Ignavibacteria bacterium CG2_30_36_16]PJB00881.1 MAG: CcoQ/FixQ family Cbb3-type cytochrome c oxidase assembly chaperone [Ignavibacteria bacterium CG_4_9_14_3_um_filter_36_18]